MPASDLVVEGVSKTYSTQIGESVQALGEVNFTARAGEFISLIGASGCGKTTLLKICAGLLTPTTGQVGFGEEGAKGLQPRQKGVVFQGSVMLPWRTVLENVMLPADVLRLNKSEATERARELLRMVRLDNVENKYPGELSGGMQQRASLARALLHDPHVIFMDEPFGALDAMTREALNEQLQEIHLVQSKTVLFVTHNIQEAVFLSDRVIVMSPRPGRIIADIPINLERPRKVEDYVAEDFRELESQIRQYLDH